MHRAITIAACTALVASTTSAACTREKLTESIKACDSLVNISQIKCDNKECHKALHVLVEADYIQCYVQLGLGTAADLTKYKLLDDFCHGEGPDPTESNAAAAKSNQTSTNNSTSSNKTASTVATAAPVTLPSTAPAPTPSPSSAASAVATASTAAVVIAATASVLVSL